MKKILRNATSLFLSILLVIPPSGLSFAKALDDSSLWFDQLSPSELESLTVLGQERIHAGDVDQLSLLIIRDLHADEEAQLNIARLLELVRRKSRDPLLVFVEGAVGPVDVSFFGTFPDQEIRKKITRDFVRKGWTTGPEYLAIAQFDQNLIDIWGVEDRALYIENFKQFRRVIRNITSFMTWFEALDQTIAQLKKQIYPQELFELDTIVEDREKGFVGLDEYVQYLH